MQGQAAAAEMDSSLYWQQQPLELSAAQDAVLCLDEAAEAILAYSETEISAFPVPWKVGGAGALRADHRDLRMLPGPVRIACRDTQFPSQHKSGW